MIYVLYYTPFSSIAERSTALSGSALFQEYMYMFPIHIYHAQLVASDFHDSNMH